MRRRVDCPVAVNNSISIHAPVKGATIIVLMIIFPKRHFNPRTREGCDAASIYDNAIKWADFNPRTREGCDMNLFAIAQRKIDISIHAPVKGATRRHGHEYTAPCHFNPRTREGCDALYRV